MSDFFDQLAKTFIVSSGRTGTKFFGETVGSLVDHGLSDHEPDKLNKNRIKAPGGLKLVWDRGVWRLFVSKSLGTAGARNHSLNYFSGKLTEKEVLHRFRNDRKWLPKDIKLFVESNTQLYGMTEPLCKVPNSRLIIIVREPTEYVRSMMTKLCYAKGDLLSTINTLGLKRITPEHANIEEPKWKDWNRQSKLAWVWLTQYSDMLKTVKKYPDITRVAFFEDIFQHRDELLINKMLDFMTHEQISEEGKLKFLELQSKKINASDPKKEPRNPKDIDPVLYEKLLPVFDEFRKIADHCWK